MSRKVTISVSYMIKLLDANKNLLKGQFVIALMLILSSCLPVQKKTQCGDNEAFNGSQRKCVPVVGAASTGTVFITSRTPDNSYTVHRNSAAVTHQLTISDVYEYGYSVKWVLSYTGGLSTSSSVVATDVSNYTFIPPALFNFYGDGSYVLEAVVYDSAGTNQLDAVPARGAARLH